ncbi:MAG: hypothetical protein ABR503_16275 [Chitinophagaceae bacterium]
MKKNIFLFTLLVIAAPVFSQQTNPPQSLKHQDYLKKSKNQKTAAGVMLIGGTVTMTVGVGIALGGGGLDCAFGSPDCKKNQTLAGILFYSGSAAILGSIPLFIAAGKNKKKGMSLSVSGQPAPRIIKNNLAHKTVPSITLKIGL